MAAVVESSKARPVSLLTALEICDKQLFSNICTVLRISVTISITTASGERSFSTLKKLKSYLMSNMSTERLSSLALIYVHKNLKLNHDDFVG